MLRKVDFLLWVTILMLTCLYQTSAIRKYEWVVQYKKHNPDGVFRPVIAIGDGTQFHFPGPLLRIPKGEWVQVIVHNEIQTESISVHWHGLHQFNTPWMDGVQQVTQFPILPTKSFNYTFKAEKVGTHWYHSHTGGQYTDGLLGPLIVDDPNDPYQHITEEHILMLSEWYHQSVIDTFDIFTPYAASNAYYNPDPPFVSGLVNGKGQFDCKINNLGPQQCWRNSSLARFPVIAHETYRLRIIAAASQFTYLFSIDNHNLTIIVIDGIYVEPYTVQRIYIDIGQRYDVLVKMDQTVGNYWIRTRVEKGGQDNGMFNAVLQYEGASDTDDPTSVYVPPEIVLKDSSPLIPTANNRFGDPLLTLKPPQFTVRKEFEIECNDPIVDRCWINHRQYRLPRHPTLLNMYNKIVHSPYDNQTHIVEVNYGDRVMMIINNRVGISHPLHLHGHDFYILGIGPDSPNDDFISYNASEDEVRLNLENPPIRDSVTLPARSWLVIGFLANNPGSWLFHCHIAFDMEAGMGFVLNVRNGAIPPPPPSYLITDEYRYFLSGTSQSTLPVLLLLLMSLLQIAYKILII